MQPDTASAEAAGRGRPVPWTHARFFGLLRRLGCLRIIHQSGPSTFEAIATMGDPDFSRGFMNAITDPYHWHLQTSGFGFVQSFDETHARSGRRVLFFELRDARDSDAFLRIYLYRPPNAEFDADAMAAFAEAHAELQAGSDVRTGGKGE